MTENHMGPRRSVHRTIFFRRCHQSPPWPSCGNRLSPGGVRFWRTNASPNYGGWRVHGGRIVAPPRVLLPGPFNTTRCRVALAAYSALRIRAAASVRERTRTGRLWFCKKKKPHRLYRLSAVHLRLTHSSASSFDRINPDFIRIDLVF